MKFLVRYNAHIIEEKRPKDQNFPAVVTVNHIYDAQNDQDLGNQINDNYAALATAPGITFFRDPTKQMQNGTGNVTNRFFLPWHMIAYMDVFVTKITEQQEQKDESKLVPAKPDIIPEPKGRIQ